MSVAPALGKVPVHLLWCWGNAGAGSVLRAHADHLEVLIVMSCCLQLVLKTNGLLLQASSSQIAAAASMAPRQSTSDSVVAMCTACSSSAAWTGMSVEYRSWAGFCAGKLMLARLSRSFCVAPDQQMTRRGVPDHRRSHLQVHDLLFQPLLLC